MRKQSILISKQFLDKRIRNKERVREKEESKRMRRRERGERGGREREREQRLDDKNHVRKYMSMY